VSYFTGPSLTPAVVAVVAVVSLVAAVLVKVCFIHGGPVLQHGLSVSTGMPHAGKAFRNMTALI
jgi:hypothetical protein